MNEALAEVVHLPFPTPGTDSYELLVSSITADVARIEMVNKLTELDHDDWLAHLFGKIEASVRTHLERAWAEGVGVHP